MTEEKYFFEKEVFSRKNYNFAFEFDKSLITKLLKQKTNGKVVDNEHELCFLMVKK